MMDYVCDVWLLISLFLTQNTEGCTNNNFAMIGYEVSLDWKLGNISTDTINAMVYHYSEIIAQIADGECKSINYLSVNCSMTKDGYEWVLSLTIFNVSKQNGGNYSLQYKLPSQADEQNNSKKLVVIGKPKVKEVKIPILYQAFELSCSAPSGMRCFTYRWKINGSDASLTSNRYSVLSLNMTYNFNQVTCQVCLNRSDRNVSSKVSMKDACSEKSNPYTIRVIYGPVNVSLNVTEKQLYIRKYEQFAIECFANCSPLCLFYWTAQDSSEGEKLFAASEKLVFIGFKSTLAGVYTCYATNKETNITLKSNGVVLMEVEDDTSRYKEKPTGHTYTPMIGIVLIGFALLLAVIGTLLIIHWRRNASKRKDTRQFQESFANLHVIADGESSIEISRIQNTPLPISNNQETFCNYRCRQMDLIKNRYSKSLHNLLDPPHDLFFPLRGGVSSQGLSCHSGQTYDNKINSTDAFTMGRRGSFHTSDEIHLDRRRKHENSVSLNDMYTNVREEIEAINSTFNVGSSLESSRKTQQQRSNEGSQENLYSTVDDIAF